MPEPREDLDRRAFLGHAAVLGAAAAGGMQLPAPRRCRQPGAALGPRRATPGPPFELEEVTVAELQAGMASGRYTRAARRRALPRRASRPWTGRAPALQSDHRDQPRRARPSPTRSTASARPRAPRGPLHGIPVLLKDNIDTADRMTTTAGSLALEGSIAAARRARRRAAARGRRGAPRQGEPERVGQHPLRPARPAAGARAAGSAATRTCSTATRAARAPAPAAAVAANLGAVGRRHRDRRLDRLPAVGQRRRRDQADGRAGEPGRASSRSRTPRTRPARWPHRGRRGRAARRAGRRRSARRRRPPRPPGTSSRDYTGVPRRRTGCAGARIGVARAQVLRLQRRHRRAGRGGARGAAARGRGRRRPGRHPARRRATTTPSSRCCSTSSRPTSTPTSPTLGPTAPVRTLADVIAFNERERDREMPYFGQELFLQAEAKGPLTDAGVPEGAARPAAGWRATTGIDAVHGQAPARRDRRADRQSGLADRPGERRPLHRRRARRPRPWRAIPASPCRRDTRAGCRSNLSFIGRAWSEPTLIRLAYAFEQITMHRKAPRVPADPRLTLLLRAVDFPPRITLSSNRDLHGRHQRCSPPIRPPGPGCRASSCSSSTTGCASPGRSRSGWSTSTGRPRSSAGCSARSARRPARSAAPTRCAARTSCRR